MAGIAGDGGAPNGARAGTSRVGTSRVGTSRAGTSRAGTSRAATSWPDVARLDGATRAWWRLVGRRVDLTGPERWLDAPRCGPGTVGDRWLQAEAERLGATLHTDVTDGGLLPSMAVLDGPGFRAADLDPTVRDFYEHTARWRMEVWTQWSGVFQPGGEMISRLFGRRVQQLALPTRPLDVAHGMDSRVVHLLGEDGRQLAAGWLRTLAATGEFVYSGCYAARRLPGSDRPSVHVAFPLEQGNVQVFLRPSVGPDGSLVLSSPPGGFGADGAYVVVGGDRADRAAHAARLPLHERFHVYRDGRGVLRTDHVLQLHRFTVLRLHYRLDRG